MSYGYKYKEPSSVVYEPVVYRNKDGFYPRYKDSYFDSYYRRIDEKAVKFCRENKEQLEKLHSYISMKESIMENVLSFVDEKYQDLAKEIILFLGYNIRKGKEETKAYYNKHSI